MARPLRIEYAGAVYHITSRGNERKPVLFTEKIIRDEQKRDRKLAESVERHVYTQGEIAEYLDLHDTSVSRIINERG